MSTSYSYMTRAGIVQTLRGRPVYEYRFLITDLSDQGCAVHVMFEDGSSITVATSRDPGMTRFFKTVDAALAYLRSVANELGVRPTVNVTLDLGIE